LRKDPTLMVHASRALAQACFVDGRLLFRVDF
jgi:hypothetical protein